MNDDEFKSLLRKADAGHGMPVLPSGEVIARVRRIERRRAMRLRIVLTAAPVVLVGIVAGWTLLPRAGDVAPSAAVVRAEIEQLRAAAEFHERAARQMVALAEWERTQAQLARRVEADPFEEIREQVDVVAYRMVLRADGLHARRMGSAEAVELYREVLRLFPKTYSAEVARERLAGLGARVEET